MVGTRCCVPGCRHNKLKQKELHFYVIPKGKELRETWLNNMRESVKDHPMLREKFSTFVPKPSNYVCSIHFKGGKKTYMINTPTVFPPYVPPPRQTRRRRKKKDCLVEPEITPKDDSNKESAIIIEHPYSCPDERPMPNWRATPVSCYTKYAFGIETEIYIGDNITIDGSNHLTESKVEADKKLSTLLEIERAKTAALTSQLNESKEECMRLKSSVNKLLSKIHPKKCRNYSAHETLSIEPERFKFYTGLTVEDFNELFKFVLNDIPKLKYVNSTGVDKSKLVKRQRLLPKDELLLVLFRLTAGLEEKDIAYRFGVNVRAVPVIYRAWADLLYSRFDC